MYLDGLTTYYRVFLWHSLTFRRGTPAIHATLKASTVRCCEGPVLSISYVNISPRMITMLRVLA